MDDPQARPHGGDGQFVRSLTTAQRDAEAARLRSLGWSYPRIAAELGFNHRADAHNAVKRVLKETVREAGENVRALELERLDAELARLADVEREVWTVLKRKHVTVSNGQVIRVDGEPLLDDAPVLQAADRLVKIEDARRRNGKRRAELLGLDAPTKQHITISPERAAALEQLVEELGEQ
ncbi:hypothetical protein IFE09_27100 [Streptomyces microflavus]|nr:hypothetical protein [Streptomyces microflavus]QQZ56869.1 hypothetical protein IFE09_27100 [Streptomyces microflavus]